MRPAILIAVLLPAGTLHADQLHAFEICRSDTVVRIISRFEQDQQDLMALRASFYEQKRMKDFPIAETLLSFADWVKSVSLALNVMCEIRPANPTQEQIAAFWAYVKVVRPELVRIEGRISAMLTNDEMPTAARDEARHLREDIRAFDDWLAKAE